MKLAICNETYVDWPFDRICADAAECGYDGIEIAPSTLDPDPRNLTEDHARAVGEMAHRAGLEVVGLHWLLKAPEGMHLTTPDSKIRKKTIRYLEHLARLCAAMGGSVLVLGSPKQRGIEKGGDRDGAWRHAVDGCRRVAETAGPLGVTLAIEPLASYLTNFVTTAAEGARLVEAVDHEAFRLHLDVFAMSSEDAPIPRIVAEHGQSLAHVHVNDTGMGGPGSGDVDYPTIIAALRAVHYDGFLSVEVFDFAPGGPKIARDSIEFLRGLPGLDR
jgi:sugar phosphate isomerase/epimerase